jgi:enoyl-CoA hydratase/carnithine racemase
MNAFNRFERMPTPVVAAVQGLCFGRGLEFALRADIVFAGESARFGHPEQTLGITTMLGGIYRGAARTGRFRAAEWALTSEQVPAATMEQFGVVNRVVPDMKLLEEAHSFALKMARGPTRAHAAHKALLRTWAAGGVDTADQTMFDIAMPLFETEDAIAGLTSAIKAAQAGQGRPVVEFKGR